MKSLSNSHKNFSRRSLLLASGSGMLLAACGHKDHKPVLVGQRVNVFSSGAGLMVDKDDQTPITIPPPVIEHQWMLEGRVPSHASIHSAIGGVRKLWDCSIGSGNSEPSPLAFIALGSKGRGIINTTPVVDGDRFYTMDAVGKVTAFDSSSRKVLWRLNPNKKGSKSSNLGGGIGLTSDALYIVDGVAETLRVDRETGKVVWRVDLGTPGRSAPTIVGDRVFFGTIDGSLFCLDAKTGTQLWSYRTGSVDTKLFGQPAPAYFSGILVAGFGTGDLVALRAQTGEEIWTDTLGRSGRDSYTDFSAVSALPIIVDGTVYAISLGSVLVAIDVRSGRRLWEREASGQNAMVAIADWLFVLSLDQQLACLDRITGRVRWVTQLRRFKNVEKSSNPIAWYGPVLGGGQLICISDFSENGLVTVDPATGKVTKVVKTDITPALAPVIVNERLLVVGQDGKLTAFG
ncbi:outer membrane protein assembly factor BamB family protein [Commensalibacter oyaizuii]|uniref:PQQ-like beta-propeller repeat protein n=1 Tax=Commensalibacter oyaizuii TaxID=3043873 RepID=A0ABT6PZZ8_9PROT|nr:PQQ-binding-like beta-propeller repeat protein [Commensalibacter sp. TBRC 16381]MDI2090440.1 PQQ-like beta-propeller repeat protein [Commensalibacter sp. TBRC 16381]